MEEKEKNEKSEQTLKNLGREELIMRLKEMANAEVLPMEERPMGAMCYSISLPEPIYTFVCPKCGSKYNVYEASGNRVEGPATRGLKQYQTALSGTKLYVTN